LVLALPALWKDLEVVSNNQQPTERSLSHHAGDPVDASAALPVVRDKGSS